MKADCIFCKIAQKEAESDIVYEDDKVVAFKTIDPIAETHVLIIPKSHVQSFLGKKTRDEIQAMTGAAQEIIQEMKIDNAYKLVFNGGRYQEVPHLHWHLLGGKFLKDISKL